jgi:hypothetical protein
MSCRAVNAIITLNEITKSRGLMNPRTTTQTGFHTPGKCSAPNKGGKSRQTAKLLRIYTHAAGQRTLRFGDSCRCCLGLGSQIIMKGAFCSRSTPHAVPYPYTRLTMNKLAGVRMLSEHLLTVVPQPGHDTTGTSSQRECTLILILGGTVPLACCLGQKRL